MTSTGPREKLADPDAELRSVHDELSDLRGELKRIRQLLENSGGRSRSKTTAWWSLRNLFIVLTLLACFFAWTSYEIRRSKRIRSAAEELASLGASVTSRPSERLLVSMLPGRPNAPPAALRYALGPDLFVDLERLTINKPLNPSDRERFLYALGRVKGLRDVRIYNTQLSSGDLEPLWEMAELTTLQLPHTRLSRGSLSGIEKVPLIYFDASHTLFDDAAATSLSGCESLEVVKLDRTAITDSGVKQLAKLTKLRELHIRRSPISLKAVVALSAAMPDCYILYEPLIVDNNGNSDTVRSRRLRRTFGTRNKGHYRSDIRQAPWNLFSLR